MRMKNFGGDESIAIGAIVDIAQNLKFKEK